MQNLNSPIFEEVKSTLMEIKPEEFDINQYINKVEEIKKKYEKPITWQHDDYDNWYDG
jgi:hypothetical protein